MAACTGIAATWCPVHGDCTCPMNEHGEPELRWEGANVVISPGVVAWDEHARTIQVHDPECPLHGPESRHADG